MIPWTVHLLKWKDSYVACDEGREWDVLSSVQGDGRPMAAHMAEGILRRYEELRERFASPQAEAERDGFHWDTRQIEDEVARLSRGIPGPVREHVLSLNGTEWLLHLWADRYCLWKRHHATHGALPLYKQVTGDQAEREASQPWPDPPKRMDQVLGGGLPDWGADAPVRVVKVGGLDVPVVDRANEFPSAPLAEPTPEQAKEVARVANRIVEKQEEAFLEGVTRKQVEEQAEANRAEWAHKGLSHWELLMASGPLQWVGDNGMCGSCAGPVRAGEECYARKAEDHWLVAHLACATKELDRHQRLAERKRQAGDGRKLERLRSAARRKPFRARHHPGNGNPACELCHAQIVPGELCVKGEGSSKKMHQGCWETEWAAAVEAGQVEELP